MLKKTALCLSVLLLSSSACAQMLVQFDLVDVVDQQVIDRQSVVIEGNEKTTCQLTDLLLEVGAAKEGQDVNIALKISRVVVGGANILVAEREFTTSTDKSASLSLEKDNKEMQLIIVAKDIE